MVIFDNWMMIMQSITTRFCQIVRMLWMEDYTSLMEDYTCFYENMLFLLLDNHITSQNNDCLLLSCHFVRFLQPFQFKHHLALKSNNLLKNEGQLTPDSSAFALRKLKIADPRSYLLAHQWHGRHGLRRHPIQCAAGAVFRPKCLRQLHLHSRL